MPRPTAQLTKNSSPEEIKRAIAATIAVLIKEGYDQKQATAIAFKEAREKTGEGLRK